LHYLNSDRMAVYGIGAVIKLIEHIDELERANERLKRGFSNPTPGSRAIDSLVESLRADAASSTAPTGFPLPPMKKKKRKATAASKRYGKCFKKIQHKYKKKNGSWKKDGFKRCAAAARRMAKK
jgi:hypothetical protein